MAFTPWDIYTPCDWEKSQTCTNKFKMCEKCNQTHERQELAIFSDKLIKNYYLDMIDVANAVGSAYLYKKDIPRITEIIKMLSSSPAEYHNLTDVGKNEKDYKYPWKYTEEERPCEAYCKCYDCGMSYGDFHDMVLPDGLWELINPSQHNSSGLLCPTCIVNRLDFIGKWYDTGLYKPVGAETLQKAKEALERTVTVLRTSSIYGHVLNHVEGTIAEIDKVIGGGGR